MEKNNKKDFIENVIYYAIIAGLLYIAYLKLLPALIPFIIGFIIAYIAQQITKKAPKSLNPKLKIVVLIILYLLLGLILLFTGYYLVDKIQLLVEFISEQAVGFEPVLNSVYNSLASWTATLPKEVTDVLNSAMGSVFDSVKNLLLSISGSLVSFVTTLVAAVPNVIVQTIVVIVASFLMYLDYSKFTTSIRKFTPKKIDNVLVDLVEFIKTKLFKIIKSYIMIMALTFAELFVGLFIIGVKPAGTYAMLIAVLDILPILGVGTVLIPWGVIDLILGNYLRGILVLILYFIITAVRQVVEPKLVGADLGLDALTTLIAMMVGLDLFGLLGMFAVPITLSFLIYRKNKNEEIEKVV